MRCLIWAAVSSKPQAADEKDSIPSQIEASRELVERNDGWHEIGEPLIIPGHSRSYIFLAEAAVDMPVYTELMSLAREGEMDLLICRGRDRLGRTDALIAQVEEYLASYNVQILSLSMPTRVQDPDQFAEQRDRASIWMRSVERARAQDEVAELQARFRMGTRRRVKEGYHPNNNLPFGYRLGEEGFGIPYQPEAHLVRKVFAWFLEGQTYQGILRLAKAHAIEDYPRNATALKHMLALPYYSGRVTWRRWDHKEAGWRDSTDWITGPGKHEAIIPEETWLSAQREMAARREQGKRHPYTKYPLSGFVYCGYCEQRMTITGGGSTRGFYQYLICPHPRSECPRPTARNGIRLEPVEESVLNWIIERATSPALLEEELLALADQKTIDATEDLAALQAAESRILRALEQWTNDYESLLIDRSEYYTRRESLEEELELIQGELQQKERAAAHRDHETMEKAFAELVGPSIELFRRQWYGRENAQEIKALLRQIGLRIVITAGATTPQLSD